MVDLKKLVEKREIISKDDLFDIMINYVLDYNLDTDIDLITLDTGYKSYGLYIKYMKKINVNYDKLVSELSKIYNKVNFYDNININFSILATAIHEIKHANQYKIIRTKSKDEIICKALSSSYSKTGKELYKTNHDDYIIEYNASLDASFETIKFFLDAGFGENVNFAKNIYNLLYSSYYIKNVSDERLSPLEKFNYLLGEPNYKDIAKYDYSNIESIDKILFGLPIKEKELRKILDLKRRDNVDMYEYFETNNSKRRK